MPIEYEKKFLVTGDGWKGHIARTRPIVQGYGAVTPLASVRVRTSNAEAWLTAKGQMEGHGRPEFEYPIPITDARQILADLVESTVVKTRHDPTIAPYDWTIDVFEGHSKGLIISEIKDREPLGDIALPSWVGEDVAQDKRYPSAYLSQHPFDSWE